MFQSQHGQRSGLYHVQVVLMAECDIDIDAFRQSWQQVMARHQPLRTSLRRQQDQGQEPVQAVWSQVDIPFRHDDWSELDSESQDRALRTYLEEDLARGFTLDEAPLWRLFVCRSGDARWHIVWSLHYIILDGLSQAAVLYDVEQFYGFLTEQRPPRLRPAPSFQEYVRWLGQQDVAEAEAFWRQTLRSVAPAAPLAVERRSTPDEPTSGLSLARFDQTGLVLAEAETAALAAAAELHAVSVDTLARGCWALLLSRYTGADDVVIGVTAPGRHVDLPGVEHTVGLLINTLPLRTDVPGDLPWASWVQRLHRQYAQLERYAYSPLLSVRQWSGIGAGNTLFDTVLSVEPHRRRQPAPWLPLVTQRQQEHAPFALRVVITPGDCLTITIHYDTQRFAAATVDRMLGHLRQLLTSLVRQPEASLAQLSMLTEPEYTQLVHDHNDTEHPYSDQVCLHELFERQVAAAPDAVAVLFEQHSWTYREINQTANRIAHHLRDLGVGRGTQVAILLDRSMEMIPALLAVLKAGGSYVPLQANAPVRRWHYVLDSLDIGFVLTQQDLLPRLGSADPLPRLRHVVCVDRPADLAQLPTDDLAPTAGPQDLAYVIFTSGSTGTPKGVVVAHHAAVNVIEWVNRTFAVGPDDRLLFVTSLSFDLSVYDIFGVLAAGGSIRVASRQDIQEPTSLLRMLSSEPITFWDSAPAALMQLVPFLPGADAPQTVSDSLRLVFMSGDWIPVHAPDLLTKAFPNVRVISLGGATEATVWSNFFPIERVDPGWPSIPYGKPIQNSRYYILDQGMLPCPVDVPGDLYIGGTCLSLGYAGAPDLTASKFVASPFGPYPGERIYKTGDLARWRPDGNMEFLGRTDSQVKVRGYRIELGEIDSVLAKHPAVRDAATAVRTDRPGDASLVSYLVLDKELAHTAGDHDTAGLADDRVKRWQQVYDTFDEQPTDHTPDGADFSGWTSSYTGQPIPVDQMRAWQQDTLALIRAGRPQVILEIGCGTGLLLFPLAPHCRRYYATDFSSSVLRSVAHRLEATAALRDTVVLSQRPADDLSELVTEPIDTVVLNSVVQYFPDVSYLLRVLDGALDRVATGGRIIVGDVRSFPLLEAFHASVELSRAPDDMTRAQLRHQVHQRVRQEEELTLDPAFFRDWAASTGRVRQVEIRLKHGGHHNELVGFRYQVVLHVGPPLPAESRTPPPTLDLTWPEAGLTRADLHRILADERPRRLRLRRVPNARVQADVDLLRWLKDDTGAETVQGWRATAPTADGMEPDDVAALADQVGYHASVSWADHGADGSFTVLLTRGAPGEDRQTAVDDDEELLDVTAATARSDTDWHAYANPPLRAEVERMVIPQIQAYLRQRLPEYMVPAELVVLGALPVTPSGKLDRKALLAPVIEQPAGSATYLPARNTTEALLVSIYEQVLARSPIGTADGFFELGGHSLLAVQLVARIRQVFGLDLPVRAVFDLPTIAQLAPQLQRLQQQAQPLQLPPLTPAPRDLPLPASFDQQRLFFLDRLHPGSNFYTVNWLIPWPAGMPREVLEAGLHDMLGRHESLRTTFREDDGRVWQVVADDWHVDLPVIDLSGVPAEQRQAQAQAHIRRCWAEPFDLARGPLLRTVLLDLADAGQVLVLTAHHTVFDGYSIGLFGQELLRLCHARDRGQDAALPAMAVQYGDYAVWQQHWLDEQWLRLHLDHWRQQLAAAPDLLGLPTDFPRPEVQTYRGAFLRRPLRDDLTEQLREFSSRAQVTTFITLLAGAAVLLSRHSGQDVVVIGVPIANRHRVELEPMIGFLVNTVALCVDLRGNPTFDEVLHQVRRQLFDAQSHQEIPFDRVVEALCPERSLSHNPIFQVMVADESLPLLAEVAEQAAPAPWIQDMIEEGMSLRVARFDLCLMVREDANGLRLGFEYSTDLFTEPTIARMADRFDTLLASALAEPGRRVKQLDLMPEHELTRVVDRWSGRSAVQHEPAYLHELFAAQAARTPDAVALVFGDSHLSYAELDRRANQLAHALQGRGVGPEFLVGLYLERSIEVIVALLGILKSGGAYVPLDPGSPADRIALLTADAGLRLVLTQSHLRDRLPADVAAVCLDTDWSTVAGEPAQAPPTRLSPDNLAYIIYTSGSTGRPKGVMVAHRCTHHIVSWQRAVACFAEPQRTLQVASFCFDFSVWEIIMPLLTGGTLVLPRPDLRMIGADLCDVVVERAIENLNFTPAALATMPSTDLPHLRTLVVGGEAYSADLIRSWAPGRVFFNVYGPTETTVFATGARLDEHLTTIHMGGPISDVELYVLDPDLQPVPIGVPGELHIGGAGLTRGYLDRPDLTAQQFIADPFATRPGSRLYRSGDLVRFLPDGNIEFLGRIDHQVKIRGFRIELGEIESALAGYPSVRGAAVLVHGEANARRLVAYLVADEAIDPEALQRYLGERLPGYMVPGVFVPLDRLPLNANDKVDRKALADLPWERFAAASTAPSEAPCTPVERQLAQIWHEVLATGEPVGRHDNFFVLGGDSIVSLQVIFRAKQVGIQLTVKQVFQYQTIAELGAVAQLRDPAAGPAGAAEQGPVTGAVELTPVQQWLFDQELAQPHHFNQALLLDVPTELTPAQWQRILLCLVTHHDGLRARFVRHDDGWRADLLGPAEQVPLPVHDLAPWPPDERADRLADLAAQVQWGFDLAAPPLLAAALFTGLDGGRHRLLLVAHHLVVDVVSWRILLDDLHTLIARLREDRALELPAKSTSWQQWAGRLRQEAGAATTLDELDYWLEQIEPPTRPLPLATAGEHGTVGSARTREVGLDPGRTRALTHDVAAVFHTRVDDVLLTAVAAAVGAVTGDTNVIIDVEGHGREDLFDDVDLSRTVGWFTTISPVRLPVAAPTALVDGLKAVKERLRRRPRHGIGYGLLRTGRTEAAERLAAAAAAQVSFNHLGTFDGADSVAVAYEAIGGDMAADNRRPYAIDIVSRVQDGELRMQWTYDEKALSPHIADTIVTRALAVLDELAAMAGRADLNGYSPSDLPVSGLSQTEIDDLVEQLRTLPGWRESDQRRPLQDCYPQTPLQQGLWFQSQYAQGQGLYHVQLAHQLPADLHVDAWRAAWAEVMQRHPILRTGFWNLPDHDPLQLVWQRLPVPMRVEDWRGDPPNQQRHRLETYLCQERVRGFDPHEAPQWRMLLARTVDGYQLVFSMHHAILDGWSYALLRAEVLASYDALVAGTRPALPPAPRYRDYVAWSQHQDMRQAQDYWRTVLEGLQEAQPLRIERGDGQPDAGHTTDRREASLLFDEPETVGLQELANRNGLTLNTVLQGCWALLLSRYGDTDDVVFGVVVSGRPAEIPGVERMVGLFINTLPLRVRLPASTGWLTWIRDLQEQNLQMRQFEFSPIDRVQRWSGLPTGSELFNTLFVFENYPVEQSPSTALRLDSPRSEERVHYPIGVVATLAGQRLHVTIQYDPHRFDQAAIERLLAHLRHICAQIVAAPEAELGGFSILTDEEREQILRQQATSPEQPPFDAELDLAALLGDEAWPADQQELLDQLVAEISQLSPADLRQQIELSSSAAEKSDVNE